MTPNQIREDVRPIGGGASGVGRVFSFELWEGVKGSRVQGFKGSRVKGAGGVGKRGFALVLCG